MEVISACGIQAVASSNSDLQCGGIDENHQSSSMVGVDVFYANHQLDYLSRGMGRNCSKFWQKECDRYLSDSDQFWSLSLHHQLQQST
jgi:hypothetical protein